MSVFDKIINFINIFRKTEPEGKSIESYSKFKEYLFFLNEEDDNYEQVNKAVELCDEALKIAKKRVVLLKKYGEYKNILIDLESYSKLNDVDAQYLKSLVDKFVSLTKERNVLRYQIGDFDKSLTKLIEYEQEAPKAVVQMEDAEQKKRVLQHDIGYLQGEKEDAEQEKINLEFGMDFIYKFTMGMTFLFGTVIMVLVLLNVFKEQVIFFPLTILCIMMIFLITLIYIFRRKIKFELQVNIKKKKKIIEILNKKNVVYSYYVNFLDYVYNKYNVRSSAALRANLNDYSHYKHVTSRYDSIRNIMYQTQKILEDFLREKNINDVSASIETFAQTINIGDKIEYSKEILENKEKTQNQIQELDDSHEIIWNQLMELNDIDKSKDKIIESIIQAYLDEAGKLIFDIDKEEEFLYNSQIDTFTGNEKEE